MFGDIAGMIGNYNSRKIGRDNFDWGFISTAYVTDGSKDYETAVEHKNYNGGSMVIVESYDGKEAAKKGHDKWIKIMTSKKLPTVLTDCSNSAISNLYEACGGETEFERNE